MSNDRIIQTQIQAIIDQGENGLARNNAMSIQSAKDKLWAYRHEIMRYLSIKQKVIVKQVIVKTTDIDRKPIDRVPLATIVDAVCAHYNTNPMKVFAVNHLGKMSRKREVVDTRKMIATIGHDRHYSLCDIGKYFGGQDHTTIMNLRRRMRELMDSDYTYKQAYNEIQAKIDEQVKKEMETEKLALAK